MTFGRNECARAMVVSLVLAVTANADLFPPGWGSPGVLSAIDPTGDQQNTSSTAADIEKCWFAQDASFYYFRMDLRSAPTVNPQNFASTYGIHLDTIPNAGGDWDLQSYVPYPVTGIDYIVDAHFDPTLFVGGWGPKHYHVYLMYGGTYTTFSLAPTYGDFGNSLNDGRTLEWKVAKSEIAGTVDPQKVWYGTYNIGSSQNKTHDLAQIPEPATLLLGGAAFVAVGARGRRGRRA